MNVTSTTIFMSFNHFSYSFLYIYALSILIFHPIQPFNFQLFLFAFNVIVLVALISCYDYQNMILLTHLSLSGGIGLGPENVLLFKISGSIFSNANLVG